MGSIVIAERTIQYRAVAGPAARGQRVLYVHGTGCNSEVWMPHMQAIADAHVPVAIDLPGHGGSPGRGFRGIADYAYYVIELAKRLAWDRFVVLGHSMGGAVALMIALQHPEMLEGLGLVDTGARLRVHPALLRGAHEAATSGRPSGADRSWAYAAATPQTGVD